MEPPPSSSHRSRRESRRQALPRGGGGGGSASSTNSRRCGQMESCQRGNVEPTSSPISSQSVSPRSSSTGLVSAATNQFGSDGTTRYQPEGSINAPHTGGIVGISNRPDLLLDPHNVRSQPDGSRHTGPEERVAGRTTQTLSLEVSRAQPEGSGGVQTFNTPSLRSPVELQTLSPTSASSGGVQTFSAPNLRSPVELQTLSPTSVSPGGVQTFSAPSLRSPVELQALSLTSSNASSFSDKPSTMKLSQSPSRGVLPELCALDPMTSGILATVERKESLPKAESSDHICMRRSSSSHRVVSLPKAISSEYISASVSGITAARKTHSKTTLSKSESEEFTSHLRIRQSPKASDLSSCNINAKESTLTRLSKIQSKQENEFRITVVTWNVGTAMPPGDVTSLLHLNTGDSNDTDMIAIGLQEVNSMISKRLKDALFTDQWSELFMDVLGPFNFVLVSTVRMQGVILVVFAKYYHLPFLQDIQTDCTRTGLGGYWGNKGGVSIRLSIFGHMVCFLNCHLPAHVEKAEQRKEDFMTILHLQQFEGPSASGILDHDIVFWFGDLNFRIESLDIRYVKYAIDNSILHQLWEKDQLNIAKTTWPILKGFQEGTLNFPPTFKFDVGTNMYDTSAKKRKPAWTDRILWKIKNSSGILAVNQLCYCSHMEYTVSDHKPVVSIFSVEFASRANVPLVELQVADEWTKPEHAVVWYKISSTYHRSSWDWIALYRVGFRHYKDYVTYIWAKQEDSESNIYQLVFPEESLPRGKGDFILGYYSHSKTCMVGVTEPFQISLPTSEEMSSSTDSSNSSSEEEDDSTMVLLGSKSRSPSPGKMTRHRSRSPSFAKFQGLMLGSLSREQASSRSPSPQGRFGSSILKNEIPSIQLSTESARRRSKSRELLQSSDSGAGSSRFQSAWRFDENPLGRADPRNLGLLPAVRLETLDQVLNHRRDSADQGQSSRRSPTSPTAALASLFGTSPKEGESQDPSRSGRDMGH